MVGQHHQLNGHGLSKLWEMVKDRQTWCAGVHMVTKSQIRLSDYTTFLIGYTPIQNKKFFFFFVFN